MKKNLFLVALICGVQNLKSQNENFEDGSITNPIPPSTIIVTATNAVNGWTTTGGSNSTWGATGNCTNTTAITGTPNACILISPGATGHIDSIIGPSYPIYSVFGNTTTTYPAATTANGFQCYGDWFIKMNNNNPGSSVNRITKRILVVPNNTLLHCAFINVLEGGHCCCDNPGFKFKLLTYGAVCTGVPNATTCPQFSASASSSVGCSPSGSCAFVVNSASYSVSTVNPAWTYNKWQKFTIDLTAYIGNCVVLEITAFDCPYGTHAGYTYFDAELSPMYMCVNSFCNIDYVPNPGYPICGSASTVTLTAPSAAWGYTWTIPGPSIIAGVQTITTNVAGNYTLAMSGPGSCSPVVKTFNLYNSPSPNLAVASITQANCTNSVNAVSLSMTSGVPKTTIIPNYSVSFSPSMPTGTIGVSANSATYTGMTIGVNTITITDSVGCTAVNTITLTACGVGVKESEWLKNISIAPNPNSGKFTVEINANIENAEIKIVNAIGQEVFKQIVRQGLNEINTGVLAKGIYHYIITQNREPVKRGKILIE